MLSLPHICQSALFNDEDTVLEFHCQEMTVKARLWKNMHMEMSDSFILRLFKNRVYT